MYPFIFIAAFGTILLTLVYVKHLVNSLKLAVEQIMEIPLPIIAVISVAIFLILMFLKMHIGIALMLVGINWYYDVPRLGSGT